MAEPLVIIEQQGLVAAITLNRPQKLNVINSAMVNAATQAVAQLDADERAKVIVIRGAGRAFAAGADLTELRALDPHTAAQFITNLHSLFAAIRGADALVLAAVHGPAFGAACELAAVCDLRIAAESARFGMPEIRVGIPSVIEAAILVPLIGLARAQYLVYTGDAVSAQDALTMGLVHAVVPDNQLDDAAAALAEQLAGYSRNALRLQKSLVRRWYADESFDRAVKLGIDHFAEAFQTDAPRRAMDAFFAKEEIIFQD